MAERPLYRITFVHQGNRYEIYAHSVGASGIFGFVEIADFSFEDDTSLVIDPAQEALQREFAQIRRTHVPLQHVLRIDEVVSRGAFKVTPIDPANSPAVNIVPFPPASS